MFKIEKISIENKNYPQILKKIKNPPKVIYFSGKILPKEKCFAIVGTRRCSPYGKEIAFQIAKDLTEAGLTIVSGMAPGIDTFAHKGALEAKGRTIAVLGTGIDEKSIYPKSNLKLTKEILKSGGALISEYPPGTKGAKFTFPKRNRIISGLSLGILVVEARLKSGALITAKYAIEQKRKVFAIPGSIFSQTSKGCHFLIKRGAKLVEEAKDILEELKIKPKIEKKKENEENVILKVLKGGALSLEEIVQKTKLSPSKVISLISLLEIEGKIKNLGNNVYALSYR